MRCKLYKDKREIFMAKLFDIYDTENLSDQQLFINILSASDFDIVKMFSQYLNEINELRDKVLSTLCC